MASFCRSRLEQTRRALAEGPCAHAGLSLGLLLAVLLCPWGGLSTAAADSRVASIPHPPVEDAVVIHGDGGAIAFRLFTNAAAGAEHLFNSIELEAYGQILLRSPSGASLGQWRALADRDPKLHAVLVNGSGPALDASRSMTLVERVEGVGWQYVALDGSAAYEGSLSQYRRAILWVEPDLLVIHDHLVGRKPARFEVYLHPPTSTILDPTWGDLRLELPGAGLRIDSPPPPKKVRSWSRVAADGLDLQFPGTLTVGLAPTNALADLDLLTAMVVHRPGVKRDLAFRLLLGNGAVGARIHREGLPTLIAFRTDPTVTRPSLTGFEFTGPVGVDVFRPKGRAKPAGPRAGTNPD